MKREYTEGAPFHEADRGSWALLRSASQVQSGGGSFYLALSGEIVGHWFIQRLGLTPANLLFCGSFAAAALIAELHGQMGYFLPIVRLRPVAGALTPRYEVAEIINLQALRDAVRSRRG